MTSHCIARTGTRQLLAERDSLLAQRAAASPDEKEGLDMVVALIDDELDFRTGDDEES